MEPTPPPIPEELLQRFHDAREQLHAARKELERAMAGAEYRHQERVDAAGERFRQAERELEAADQALHEKSDNATTDPARPPDRPPHGK